VGQSAAVVRREGRTVHLVDAANARADEVVAALGRHSPPGPAVKVNPAEEGVLRRILNELEERA
jgi:hypothetical protein